MKWLEIIQIRTGQNRSEVLVGELTEMLSNLQKKQDEPGVVLYRHSTLPSDFSLHLIHQSESGQPQKSETGWQLSSVAREFGMVNHTIWVLEKDSQNTTET